MKTLPELLGQSRAAQALKEDVRLAARSDAKVLITGESGVGKEIVAQLLHAQSARRGARLVTINCAGVPDTLLESEFFGHVRGSFTGAYRDRPGLLEQADGGTVFLDEVGEMCCRLQSVLLRFLETGEIQRVGADRAERRVNVRVVAASNRNLEAEIDKQTFRGDLFYRLNVIRLHVPALRTRLDDVPLLARHFLDRFSRQYQLGPVDLAPEALHILSSHSWPGNVRELRNVIERTLIRVKGSTITPADLPIELRRSAASTLATPHDPPHRPPSAAAQLLARMVEGHESFWSAVHEPFMARDLTRQDLRDLVALGLAEASGAYKELAALFRVESADYRRFIGLLRRYDCHVALPLRHKPMIKVGEPGGAKALSGTA